MSKLIDYKIATIPHIEILLEQLYFWKENMEERIKEIPSGTQDAKDCLENLDFFNSEISLALSEIESKRKSLGLVYSVEEIYDLFGQFDRFAIFNFYQTSEAFRKYGKQVFGYVQYDVRERHSLEEQVKDKTIRTDGIILLKGSTHDNIHQHNPQLLTEGFLASDIQSMQKAESGPTEKMYRQAGEKEIPAIKIEIPWKEPDFDNWSEESLERMSKGAFSSRHLSYLIRKSKGTLKKAQEEEMQQLILERCDERTKTILTELGMTKAEWLKFIGNPTNKDLVAAVGESIFTFEDEIVTPYGAKYPVTLDFKGFVHIYFRHHKEYLIKEKFPLKTLFQYSIKDVIRLVKQVVEDLNSGIQNCLEQKKDFYRNGRKAHYYQGDYYAIRINKEGRIVQFYPLDNTDVKT